MGWMSTMRINYILDSTSATDYNVAPSTDYHPNPHWYVKTWEFSILVLFKILIIKLLWIKKCVLESNSENAN